MRALPVVAVIVLVACILGTNATRIAVIGAGIGGSSVTFFLREHLGNNVELVVYEKDNMIGGRTAGTVVANTSVPLGAAVFHGENRYVRQFAEKFGLNATKPFSGRSAGIWNGKDFPLRETGWKLWDGLKLLWRYGMSLFALRDLPHKAAEQFFDVYNLLNDSQAFTTPEALLEQLQLHSLTQQTTAAYLRSMEVSERASDELGAAAVRGNYVQDPDYVNALVGLTSLFASGDAIYAISGGPWQIAEQALLGSRATVRLGAQVTAIQRDHDRYVVSTAESSEVFDYVVIAAPLELCNIQLPVKVDMRRRYQEMHTSYIVGRVRPGFFGQERVPDVILTTAGERRFQMLALQKKLNSTANLYKMFTHEPPQSLSKELFEHPYELAAVKRWHAFPIQEASPSFAPFELLPRLYNLNGFESAMSAMECSAVAGKNVANLIQRDMESSVPDALQDAPEVCADGNCF